MNKVSFHSDKTLRNEAQLELGPVFWVTLYINCTIATDYQQAGKTICEQFCTASSTVV